MPVTNFFDKLKDILHNASNMPVKNKNNSFNALRDKKIAIYGAGAFGLLMLKTLRNNQMEPIYFFDIKADTDKNCHKEGILILHPEKNNLSDQLKNQLYILISISQNDSQRIKIEDYLRSLGYEDINDSQLLHASSIGFDDGYNGYSPNSNYIDSKKQYIENALSLLADDKSKEIYISCINSHFSRDYSKSPATSLNRQYFDKDIPFNRNFERFIDCGAYIGDTLEILSNESKKIELYVGFEPDLKSFAALSLKTNNMDIGNAILFPCAVSDRAKALNYNITAGASSIGGNEIIQCVGIDESIINFAPNFIKMDIEGAELFALMGAKKTIEKYRPNMAVCVYHAVNHYWDVVNLLDSWSLGYKYYMRTYSSGCMETVLYAIQK